MILLSEYVNLITETLSKDVKNLRDILRNTMGEYFKENGVLVSGDNDKVPDDIKEYWSHNAKELELGRLYLNSDNDDENKELIDSLCSIISERNNVKASYNGTSNIYGTNVASSKFYSYKIDVTSGDKQYSFYITNKNNGKSLFSEKTLSPNKLLNLKSKNTFNGVSELKEAVLSSLNSKFSGDKFKSVILLITSIIDALTNKRNYTTISDLFKGTTDDFFNSIQKGNVICNVGDADVTLDGNKISVKDLLKEQSKSTISYLEKDFGEILGPFIFLTLFDKSSVTFPTSSNEELIDYYIDGHKVSAKQKGGGAPPSGASIFKSIILTPNKLNGSEKTQEEVMTNVSTELDKMNTKEEDAKYTDAEQFMIDSVCKSFRSPCVQQFVELSYKYVINTNDVVKQLPKSRSVFTKDMLSNNILTKEQSDLYTKIKDKNDGDIVDKIVGNNPLEFFKDLHAKIGYAFKSTNKDVKVDFNKLTLEEWNKLTPELKVGALVYPLLVIAVININSIYKNKDICGDDCVTSVINKQIDMKQVYLGINQKNADIECVASKGCTWRFKTGGSSVTNISKGKVSVEMIK